MAYQPKSLQFLSLFQIIVGSISLLFGIASAVLQSDFIWFVGFGIWVGVWIIVTGMLGFFGSRDRQVPNRCLGQGMQVVYIQPTMRQTSTNAGGDAVFLTPGAPGSVMQAPTGQFFVQQPGQPATFVPVSQPQAIPGSMVNQPQQTTVPGGTATGQTHQAQLYKSSERPPAYT